MARFHAFRLVEFEVGGVVWSINVESRLGTTNGLNLGTFLPTIRQFLYVRLGTRKAERYSDETVPDYKEASNVVNVAMPRPQMKTSWLFWTSKTPSKDHRAGGLDARV